MGSAGQHSKYEVGGGGVCVSVCMVNVNAPNSEASVQWVGPMAGFSMVGGAGATE